MKGMNIYNNNGKVMLSTRGMKAGYRYNFCGMWHSCRFARSKFSLVVLYSSSVGYHYRFYCTSSVEP